MTGPIPHEFAIAEVFMPPLLVAALWGTAAAWGTARVLNRFGLSKYFFHPPLVFLAFLVIYTVLIGWLVVGM